MTTTDLTIRPFEVHVPDEDLADLRRRIAAARWPSKELAADRSQGVQLAAIQELARSWTTDHDWRKCEARLNAVPQFKTEIDGEDIHFIHVKSPHENALPLIITHGWPGSVIELLEVIGPVTGAASAVASKVSVPVSAPTSIRSRPGGGIGAAGPSLARSSPA